MNTSNNIIIPLIFLAFIFSGRVTSTNAQDKLKKMPGYDQYKKMAPKIRNSVKIASINTTWSDDGSSFEFVKDGKQMKFDIKTKSAVEIGEAKPPPDRRRRRGGPARGRQYPSADSPDGKLKAYTRDRNMWISNMDGSNAIAITSDGNEVTQLKYGIATWVYGEELDQRTAMWWSPDSKKIAFYKFDEMGSTKYYVVYNQTQIQDSLETEAYPKVGAKNLPVDILIYNLETKKTITLDVR